MAAAKAAATPLPPLGLDAANPLPAFLRLIAAVNKGVGAVEREGLVPLTLQTQGNDQVIIYGHVRPEFVPTLLAADAADAGGGSALIPQLRGQNATPASLLMHPRLSTPQLRTEAMSKTADVLRDKGIVTGWRSEAYPIFGDGAAWSSGKSGGSGNGGGPLFEVERAAVPWLGARAFGVHINGYVSSSSSAAGGVARPSALWVARRSKSKPTWPGMLDHLAAGGQPAGMGATENAVKEAWEEAGVPEELCRWNGGGGDGGGGGAASRPAQGLRPVGTVTYRGLSSEGLKPDTLFVYDLELPAEFVPEPQDGEVEAFELWSVERVVEALVEAGSGGGGGGAAAEQRRYPAFKPNVAVVMIDFLVRHGFVGPDTGPEYAEVVAKLRQ